MADIKTKVQGLDPNLKARDLGELSQNAANVYEAIAIIEKRSRQLNTDIKHELHGKLEEFAIASDTIEEIQENKEQIEISKFYEKLPNPTVIATIEYMSEQLEVSTKGSSDDEEEF